MLKDQRLLIICTVWPEPLSSAAGSRMMQLIRFFLEQSCSITLACDAHETDFSESLADYPVEKLRIGLNDPEFDKQVTEINPTVVLFDRFMTEEKYGWRVVEHCPEAIRILDTEDLHCLRKARQTALKTGQNVNGILLQSDTTKREIASIYRCDLSLIISGYEMTLLQSLFGIDPALLHYIPLLADPISIEELDSLPSYDQRSNFVSIGNFLHEPNTDAVLYLKKELWPSIRKRLPHAELHVYGAYANEKTQSLHDPKQGFMIKGRGRDAKEVIRNARVLLTPLRFGAGIKGKLLEAMQCGTPSVTSTVGAEGMHGSYAWNGSIADRPEDFVASAVDLYTSPETWKAAQLNGIPLINGFFNKTAHSISLLETLTHLQKNLHTRRKANFTGAMLLHQTMAATKYMSRWIELKNKPFS